MPEKYFPPKFLANSFHCPICDVKTQNTWHKLMYAMRGSVAAVEGWQICICTHCNGFSIWEGDEMIYPDAITVEFPHDELPENIREDYDEARSIFSKSPRGASALLRLCIQKLCIALGEKGKKIDDDIASLVKKGLPIQIQQALDIVRVVGNEAVHPGTIDLNDNSEIARQLFSLINLIIENRVAQPKRIAEMYSSLPEAKIKAIENRDKPK